ncbi:MAG: hypothetical protein JWM77_3830 [Rhodospirillales bacterium]|nr:hypothetical protein [Rhodospirillales bacterium]
MKPTAPEQEVQRLRRSVRDLVALSTLPAIWRNYDLHQIADNIAATLLSMLSADFVHVWVPGQSDEPPIEVLHSALPDGIATLDAIRGGWGEIWRDGPFPSVGMLTLADDAGSFHFASAPIGFERQAMLIAGSRQAGFPDETQRLLLAVAANEATVTLARRRAEGDERRFAALVERSSDFIAYAGMDAAPHYINPAGLKLVGLTDLDEALSLRIYDFLTPETRDRVRDELLPIVLRRGRWVGELTFQHFRTGEVLPFLVDWFRIDHPRTGKPMNLATVSRDLRAQKKSESDLRILNETLEHRVLTRTAELGETNSKLLAEIEDHARADAKLQLLQSELFHAARLSVAGQMAGALAHELNQPLTAAANSIHAARRLLHWEPPPLVDLVPTVMNDAADQILRAGQIIRRMRELSTRGETDMRNESIVTMVDEASALALIGPEAIGIDVKFLYDPAATHALANRIQIQQVLTNLMRNAVEAMAGESSRTLDVCTARVDGDTIEITVSDNGPGLSPEIREHLFEPFVSSKRNGMGLGLSICRSIVEAHGGRLFGEQRESGGAVFRFTLAALPVNGELHAA